MNRCVIEDRDATHVTRLLHTLPVPEPPPWLFTRIQAAIQTERRRQRMRRRFVFALAAALHLLVFALCERTIG